MSCKTLTKKFITAFSEDREDFEDDVHTVKGAKRLGYPAPLYPVADAITKLHSLQ